MAESRVTGVMGDNSTVFG